ncbi:MAG TPA: DcaP family trimeric outer membrane transporter [Gemmataceae bacterium]|nr:DcaP family trimeric outer membrane transporter [Gemmataceae bacterium]
MPVFTRSGWPTTIAVMLAAALGSPAFGQELPSRGEVKGPGQASDEPWKASQVQADPLLSSKPPPFTLPPTATPPAAKDAAPTDPAAPKVSNDPNTFAGFPQVQDALATLLPGNFKDTRYKWYGFVRMDAIYDFRPIASTDDFVTSSIPIPQGKGRNFVMTPRYTRLGFDTLTPLKDCYDWEVKTRIEMDFFNGNTSGAFGSFPIRLRFAWIDVGPFLVGQAASLFMDYDVFPNVLDYEGPPGMVLMRQPIAAVRYQITDNLRVAAGVEHPYSDIQWLDGGGFVVNPGTGIIPTAGVPKNIQGLPDFTGNVRYTYDYGHCQVAGILRKLEFQSATEETFTELGYGVNVTGTFHPWAALHGIPNSSAADCRGALDKSRILGQFACGRGIARYIQDANGFGLDATFDTANGFRALQAYGWFLAYEHWWTDQLISNITYGQSWIDLTDTLPSDTYKAADYFAVNLIWLPVERLGLGIEFLYGTRENKDGEKGKAYRIQSGVQYRF